MDDYRLVGLFPLIVTPTHAPRDHEEFLQQITANKSSFEQLLLKHGALLLRNFPVHSAAEFARTIDTFNLGNFVNYIGGDSPRDKVEDKVYTSTEAPPDIYIPLHQELSFIKNHPRHIYFYCDIAPQQGGSTIIADARRIYNAIDPHIRERFHEKGLTYISHYYYKSKLMTWVNSKQRAHKSWTEVFETESKEEVEQKCLANEFNWRWLQRDWLEIKQTRPALSQHPLTQETVWFNQAHLYDFNPKLLGWKRYLAAKLFYWNPATRLHEIRYADGSRIPQRDLYHVMDVLNAHTVHFPWQKGDVLILDNILAMHGRATFTGKRRILTALTA